MIRNAPPSRWTKRFRGQRNQRMSHREIAVTHQAAVSKPRMARIIASIWSAHQLPRDASPAVQRSPSVSKSASRVGVVKRWTKLSRSTHKFSRLAWIVPTYLSHLKMNHCPHLSSSHTSSLLKTTEIDRITTNHLHARRIRLRARYRRITRSKSMWLKVEM